MKNDALVMNAGRLRHQITIQEQSTALDPVTGATGTAWDDVLTTMAAIATWSEREGFQGQQFVGQVVHKVTIRWPGASVVIAAGMRVVFGARSFTVQAPPENVQERNRVLQLMCIEIDGGVVGAGSGDAVTPAPANGFADEEVVAGSGTSWTLANAPNPAKSLQVYVQEFEDGPSVLLRNYTLDGTTLTTSSPYSAGALLAWYRF